MPLEVAEIEANVADERAYGYFDIIYRQGSNPFRTFSGYELYFWKSGDR